jgi:thiamine-monophosphate kinase
VNEREAIEIITAGARQQPGIQLGPGDDAAILRCPEGREIVWTTDVQAEGQHFHHRWLDCDSLGLRSLAVNLSDLAAMGAEPWAYLLALGVPEDAEPVDLEDLAHGLREGEDRWKLALAGGHTFRNPDGWMVIISMAGLVPEGRRLRRDGAEPGMGLYLSGSLGAAARGLEILRSGRGGARSPAEEAAMQRWLMPVPRLALGRTLAETGVVGAVIDVSDGLSRDLHHICRASGVGARVEAAKLPCDCCLQTFDQARCRNFCLHGGEDYELLFAAQTGCDVESLGAGMQIHRIGDILPEAAGVLLAGDDGKETPLPDLGHDHLRAS